ncbi:hypothetical protein Tco_0390099 [Tanacetum coccineum]
MALPPRDQRHKYLRFKGLECTDADIAYFEERLGKIYGRGVHRVHVFDFGGLTDLMVEGLSDRMLMEHMDTQGYSVFTSRAWMRLFEVRVPLFQLGRVRHHMSWREFILGMGLHTAEEIELAGFDAYWAESVRILALSRGSFGPMISGGCLCSTVVMALIFTKLDDTWLGLPQEQKGSPDAAVWCPRGRLRVLSMVDEGA